MEDDSKSLLFLVIFVALVLTCFIGWLILSSCLGTSIARIFSDLFSMATEAARSEGGMGIRGSRSGASSRRRHELGFSEGDGEMWEMERMGGHKFQ